MKKIFTILILGLVLSLPLAAFAIPLFPMNFTGTVTINGANAPVGSVLKAYDASNNLLAQFTLTAAGTYGGARILAESAKLSIPEYSGSSITFRINSPQYNSNAQSSLWTPSSIETYSLAFSDFLDVTKNLAFTGATPTAVVSIAVTPATFSIVAGATKQFTATGTYADATTANITSSATWTSGTTATATIGSATGLATGVAYGTSLITATYVDATNGTLTHTATLTVSASIPSGLSASAVSSSQINLSWTAASGAVSYSIYRDGNSIATGVTSTSYSSTNLTASTAYSYTVSAVNADGETSKSTAASATTQTAGGSGGGGGGSSYTPSPSPSPSPSASPLPSPTIPGLVTIPTLPSNPTIAQLQAVIAAILNNIAYLQAELLKLQPAGQSFNTNLYYGLSNNADVKRLQTFLIGKGYLASGLNTGNYYSLTVTAVKAYQSAKGITPVSGYFGPLTRAAVNADLGL